MALLSGLLGNPNQGFLTQLGLLGQATPDPLAASLDPIYYNAGDDRASRISQALHAISEKFGNPTKGQGDLAVLASAANAAGPAYKQNNYLGEQIKRQTTANQLFEQQREKRLAEEEDLGWADLIAQHPEWAGMGRKEAQKVYADLIAQEQGIQTGTGEVFSAGDWVRYPNSDPKTAKQYPWRWKKQQFNLRTGQPKETELPLGEEPGADPNLKRAQAEATSEGRETGKISAKEPQVALRLRTTIAGTETLTGRIAELGSNPGLDQIVGPTGLITDPAVVRTFSPEAAKARAQLDAILSRYVITALNAMRNATEAGGAFGNVTNYEDALIQAQAGLDRAQSGDDVRAALSQLEAELNYSNDLFRTYYQEEYGKGLDMPTRPEPKEPAHKETEGGGAKKRYNPETRKIEAY